MIHMEFRREFAMNKLVRAGISPRHASAIGCTINCPWPFFELGVTCRASPRMLAMMSGFSKGHVSQAMALLVLSIPQHRPL